MMGAYYENNMFMYSINALYAAFHMHPIHVNIVEGPSTAFQTDNWIPQNVTVTHVPRGTME